MAYTETPKEKEKRLAYYAKNKADAKAKEDKADAETARKFNETTNTDTSKNTNPMGDTYKKGGKVMKKMRRYEEGGEIEFETKTGQNKNIGDDVRARAMAAMSKNGGESEDTKYTKNLYNLNETTAPKKAAPKAAPKAETKPIPVAKAEPYKEKTGFEAKKAKALEGPGVNLHDLVKTKLKAGGKVSSASKRADGCAIRGKTRA
jgi:hypothetical protein